MSARSSRILSALDGVRHAFLDPHATPPADFLRCQQIHGDTVIRVAAENAEDVSKRKADALITRGARPVAVQTADCLPVLFAARASRAVAAVHAGWRGLHKGILLRAVEAFVQDGVVAEELVAAIGPAIGPCCFEVSADVVEAFEKDWGRLWSGGAPPWRDHRTENPRRARSQAPPSTNELWLDLAGIAKLQLAEAGLREDRIEHVGPCTYCGATGLASYRRATHEGGTAGRQWSWIARNP